MAKAKTTPAIEVAAPEAVEPEVTNLAVVEPELPVAPVAEPEPVVAAAPFVEFIPAEPTSAAVFAHNSQFSF